MPRPIEATIHTGGLTHNLQRAREAAPDARVWAVVKANAYGHGIEHAFQALRGADGFALLDLNEAQRLRTLGWRGPILLLEGVFEPRDLELCSRLNLWHVIHHDGQIDALALHKTHQPHHVYLKFNSGMNRLGFGAAAFRAAWARLDALAQVDEISLMTHLANADSDVDGSDSAGAHVAAFHAAARDLPGERSVANSAALLRSGSAADVRGDWVRPGIMLYGSAPDMPRHTAADWDLQPTHSLRSRIIAIQHLRAGDAVGYGAQWRADVPQAVGIVACGYADGYPRGAPTGTPVLVNGRRTRTVGRVSMDMLAIDLLALPGACVGDEVVLWGRSARGPATLPIDEVAQACGTVGYELMCAVAARVPVHVDEAELPALADAAQSSAIA